MNKKNKVSATLTIALVITAIALILICGCASTKYVDFYGRQYSSVLNKNNFFYRDYGKRISIFGYDGNDNVVVIPSTIRNKPVTYIYESAFRNKNLTSVTIPNSVIEIEAEAFMDNQLTSVTIPNSVTTIAGGAFSNNQLTSITIPASIKKIGARAFANNQLTSVTIPEGVTTIEVGAFSDNQLTSVTIPNSVISIEYAAFANNQLTSVTIPSSVKTIGRDPHGLEGAFITEGAFENNQLANVIISNSVTTIDRRAFMNNLLTNVIIPDSVQEIGDRAFSENPLSSVTIPNGNIKTGISAFGSFHPYFIAYGTGTYVKDGNQILRNGQEIREPATLITEYNREIKTASGSFLWHGPIYFISIDGKKPDQCESTTVKGVIKDTDIERKIPSSLRSKTLYYGTTYVPPGMHSVEVTYLAHYVERSGTTTVWSQDSLIWEHRYLFDGGVYKFTAKTEGNQIIYSIEPQ
jgi:hypothetical protein